MSDANNENSDAAEHRELSLKEIEMTSGAGIISWLQQLFGDDNSEPAPDSEPKVH